MDSVSRLPAKVPFALFCLAVVFFVVIGPVRAMLGPYSYDFAPLYGATVQWLHGSNPYDMGQIATIVHQAGYDKESAPNYLPLEPSVYLPTLFPLITPFTWMSWEPARLLWACLSAGLFAWSLLLLLSKLPDDQSGTKWLVLAGAFCFSPAALGLSHGNPSVIACSLTMLSVYWAMEGRAGLAAVAVGVVHCIKPQISIAALVLFALWGYWWTLAVSFAVPAVVSVVCFLRAPSIAVFEQWLASLHQAIAIAAAPGNVNDPTPANERFVYSMVNLQTVVTIWIHNLKIVDMLVWAGAIAFAGFYLVLRRRLQEDTRARDMAFFSAWILLIVYHRFYDEQILLMVVPFLLQASGKRNGASVPLWLCLAALAFPLHVASDKVRELMQPHTPIELLPLRVLPLIVTAMCLMLIPWTAAARREQIEAAPEMARARAAGR